MRDRKRVNNKLVIFEILESGYAILNKKQHFLRKTFEDNELSEISDELRRDDLNFYVNIKVVSEDARIIFDYEELFYSDSKGELLEVLLIVFRDMEEYEVCDMIKTQLDKI